MYQNILIIADDWVTGCRIAPFDKPFLIDLNVITSNDR